MGLTSWVPLGQLSAQVLRDLFLSKASWGCLYCCWVQNKSSKSSKTMRLCYKFCCCRTDLISASQIRYLLSDFIILFSIKVAHELKYFFLSYTGSVFQFVNFLRSTEWRLCRIDSQRCGYNSRTSIFRDSQHELINHVNTLRGLGCTVSHLWFKHREGRCPRKWALWLWAPRLQASRLWTSCLWASRLCIYIKFIR